MNKKKKFQMKSKHLLVLMTFLCISGDRAVPERNQSGRLLDERKAGGVP